MRWLPSARRNPGKAGCQRLCWVLTNAFPTIYERSPMTDDKPVPTDSSSQQKHALSQWDTEGGAGPCGPQDSSNPIEGAAIPELTNAELVQLRIRVIALENLVITLLAEASGRQLERAHEMAAFILPRPGFTPHPLTIHAAAQMTSLVERAGHWRLVPPGRSVADRREEDPPTVTSGSVQS